MALLCAGPCCGVPFDTFNRTFAKGVPNEIANAVTFRVPTEPGSESYAVKLHDHDAANMDHFEKDWLGVGADAWFGREGGELLWQTFTDVIKRAGSRRIKAIWTESTELKVQVIEDDSLVLVVVASLRPPTDTPHFGGPCGKVHTPNPPTTY